MPNSTGSLSLLMNENVYLPSSERLQGAEEYADTDFECID